MSQCFKDHECDTHKLNTHHKPLSECESYFTEEAGRKTKVTVVRILTCDSLWGTYQKEAEDIVAPGGTLITNPKENYRRPRFSSVMAYW